MTIHRHGQKNASSFSEFDSSKAEREPHMTNYVTLLFLV